MTISVNTQNEQEEKVLLAFLESLHYDFHTEVDDLFLSDGQKAEVLARDKEFLEGEIIAEDWRDIKREMDRVYR